MRIAYWCRRFVMLLAVCGYISSNPATGQEAPRPADADHKLADAVAAFIRTFNSHDAAALAKFWRTDAAHVNQATGERLAGRQAIQDAYVELFKTDPNCVLQLHVGRLSFVTPMVATLDCTADISHTSGEVSRSKFSAILVQDAGDWLIDQVHETDVPIIPAATANLNQLQWLIGTWVDQSSDLHVMNETHWAGNSNYLVRTYQLEQRGAVARDGTQIIGWDAEQKCLRAWLFDSSGSFGEGTWQAEGDKKWVNKMVMKLADGRRGSLTQVYELTADEKVIIETVDREVDGAAQPNIAPVTLVRPGNAQPALPAATDLKGSQR